MLWNGDINGSRQFLGKLAINCVSTFASNFWQVSHLNFTNLAKSWAFRIQNFLLIFATVVATPVCPSSWKCRVIRSDIQCSQGSKARC